MDISILESLLLDQAMSVRDVVVPVISKIRNLTAKKDFILCAM
jgi:hypothetical protein